MEFLVVLMITGSDYTAQELLEVTSSPDTSPVVITSTEATPPSPANPSTSTSPPASSTSFTPLRLGSSTLSSLTTTPRESQ
jgi:hypothetical protein